MDINKLYPHQLEAYQAVMNHFDGGNQKACVVLATGTGKSYIIAAVALHFRRVLIVAPNNYVISQVQSKVDRNDVDYITYQQLMIDTDRQKVYPYRYELIVFDEFHRTGAKRWGEGVQYIMKLNPEARIFGTSATPIRYLDNGRDIAEEIFEGQVLSTLTVQDAWVRGILVPPVYVVSIEDFGKVKTDCVEKINSEYIPDEERQNMLLQLEAAQQAWNKSGGVPGVIRDNIHPDIKRIIIFCPKIETIEEDRASITGWFREAGIRINETYIIESSRSETINKNEMARFQQDGYQGVKIMISVNMLNEGVHIPNVDAVIMLRRTVSMNIYLQQMGRCMAIKKGNNTRPVILDLQNNIFNVSKNNWFQQTEKEYKESVRKYNYTGEDRFMTIKGMELNIINAIQSIDDKFNQYRKDFDWNNNYAEAKAFFDKNGHFPTKGENRRLNQWAGQWWRNNCLKNTVMNQKKMNKLTLIGYKHCTTDEMYDDLWMKNYKEAKDFYDKNGHFPIWKERKSLNSWAVNWWRCNYMKNPELHQEKAEMLTTIGFKYRNNREKIDELWLKNFEECRDWYEKMNYFPTKSENKKLNMWVYHWWKYSYLKNPELHQEKADRLMAIGFVYRSAKDRTDELWMKNYKEAKDFYDKNGHFPIWKERKSLNSWAVKWWRENYLKNPVLQQEKAGMLKTIGFVYQLAKDRTDELWMKNYEEAKEFFDKNGHFPTKVENRRLNQWAWNWWKNTYLKNTETQRPKMELLTGIGYDSNKKVDLLMEYAHQAEEYYIKYGKKIPRNGVYKKAYITLMNFWRNNIRRAKRPDIVEILLTSGFKNK